VEALLVHRELICIGFDKDKSSPNLNPGFEMVAAIFIQICNL